VRDQVHDQERDFAHDVDPAQRRVELDAVERRRAAVDEGDVAQVQVTMAFAHEARIAPRFERCGKPLALLRGPGAQRREAIARAGLAPLITSIRGGTDGSILTEMGLPTPNLFTGQHNFHSRLEWITVQDLERSVETCLELVKLWEEKA